MFLFNPVYVPDTNIIYIGIASITTVPGELNVLIFVY